MRALIQIITLVRVEARDRMEKSNLCRSTKNTDLVDSWFLRNILRADGFKFEEVHLTNYHKSIIGPRKNGEKSIIVSEDSLSLNIWKDVTFSYEVIKDISLWKVGWRALPKSFTLRSTRVTGWLTAQSYLRDTVSTWGLPAYYSRSLRKELTSVISISG